MPGLVGFWSINSGSTASKPLGTMLDALSTTRPTRKTRRDMDDVGLALGLSSHAELPLHGHSAATEANANEILLDGEFLAFDARQLGDQDEMAVANRLRDCADEAALLDLVNRIEGTFAFARLDRAARKLTIGVDALGIKPLFYLKNDLMFAFSSEVKALLSISEGSPRIDNRAFAELFAYGFVFGNRTPCADVQRVPPGSIVTFDFATRSVTVRRYWELEKLFRTKGRYDPNVKTEALIDCFTTAVQRRTRHTEKLCLALSGGLDSRAILAASGATAAKIATYTAGVAGCSDELVSRELAAIAGASNEFAASDVSNPMDVRISLDSLATKGDGFLVATDYLSLRSLVEKRPWRLRLSGHGAEAAKVCIVSPVKATRACLDAPDRAAVLAEIERQACQLPLSDAQLGQVFSKPMVEAIRHSLNHSVRESYENLQGEFDNHDYVAYWYLQNWLSRYMVANLQSERGLFEPRLPFADKDLLALQLAGEPSNRSHALLQIQTILRKNPAMGRVRNVNTGAPLGVGKGLSLLYDIRRRVASRLNVAGHRHYASVSDWLRGPFAPAVRDILLNERTLERGLVSADGLKNAVDEAMRGNAHMLNLLTPLMSTEIWFRRFIDGTPAELGAT